MKRRPHYKKAVEQNEELRRAALLIGLAQFLLKSYRVKPDRKKLNELKMCAAGLVEKLKEVKP